MIDYYEQNFFETCEICSEEFPGEQILGCEDGKLRCINCAIEDGFNPKTGVYELGERDVT